MDKTNGFKKVGDFKLRLLGLALCGLMLGGVVMAGCGGAPEDDGAADTNAVTEPAPDAPEAP